MKQSLMVLTGVVLVGLGSARADQPERVAAVLTDPSEFEIVAVKPRGPDAKPVLSSIPLADRSRNAAGDADRADHKEAAAPRGDNLAVSPAH